MTRNQSKQENEQMTTLIDEDQGGKAHPKSSYGCLIIVAVCAITGSISLLVHSNNVDLTAWKTENRKLEDTIADQKCTFVGEKHS